MIIIIVFKKIIVLFLKMSVFVRWMDGMDEYSQIVCRVPSKNVPQSKFTYVFRAFSVVHDTHVLFFCSSVAVSLCIWSFARVLVIISQLCIFSSFFFLLLAVSMANIQKKFSKKSEKRKKGNVTDWLTNSLTR